MDVFAKNNTLADQARVLYSNGLFDELRAFKKDKKKSWSALGINAEMEARIMAPPPMDMRGTAKTENQMKMMKAAITPINNGGTVTGRFPKEEKPKPLTYAQKRFVAADISVLRYVPREIHAVKGISSHGTIAIMNQVATQEKFRADPRFPLFQAVQQQKRYHAIFRGTPYQPIFA